MLWIYLSSAGLWACPGISFLWWGPIKRIETLRYTQKPQQTLKKIHLKVKSRFASNWCSFLFHFQKKGGIFSFHRFLRLAILKGGPKRSSHRHRTTGLEGNGDIFEILVFPNSIRQEMKHTAPKWSDWTRRLCFCFWCWFLKCILP